MTLEWTGSAVLEPGNAVYDPAADRWLSLPAVRATVLSSRLVRSSLGKRSASGTPSALRVHHMRERSTGQFWSGKNVPGEQPAVSLASCRG